MGLMDQTVQNQPIGVGGQSESWRLLWIGELLVIVQ